MAFRVVVWGTGNVGKPAIRAVLANKQLTLTGVLVSNPAKVGRDAGELAGIGRTGIVATNDVAAVLATKPDCVVYTATGDTRPGDAIEDVLKCLAAGAKVVTTAIYRSSICRRRGGAAFEQFRDARAGRAAARRSSCRGSIRAGPSTSCHS